MAEAITHRFAIEESQQALEAVERQETIKALIVPAYSYRRYRPLIRQVQRSPCSG